MQHFVRVGVADSRNDVLVAEHALNLGPPAFEYGGERVKILAAELVPGTGAPGAVLDERLTVACGTGALRLTRLQRPGRAALDAETLLRGWRVAPGTSFS